MLGKRTNNRQRSLRDGFNSGDVLPVGISLKGRGKNLFLLRLGAILLVAFLGLSSIGILMWLGARSIGQYLFFQNDLFRLRNVKIECDGEVITPKLIVEYLALNSCSNLFMFNMLEEHAALLQKVPRIKKADFARRLPGELTIIISERLPVARLEMGAYYLTLDREGFVLGTSPGLKNLPVISGHDLHGLRPGVQMDEMKVMRALDVLKICDASPVGNYVKIAGINVADAETIYLTLAGGEKVKLSWIEMNQPSTVSRENLERKLIRLAESLRTAAARGKKIASIDMTMENNFPAQEY